MLQRGLADTAIRALNPATTLFEPVIIGPPGGSSDLMLLSFVEELSPVEIEVADWFKSFDQVTYGYLLIVSVIFVILFLFLGRRFSVERMIERSSGVFTDITETSGQVYKLIVGQEGFSPMTSGQRVLTVGFVLFIFFLVYGIFQNLLSTDKVAERQPHTIDHIHDVLPGGRFENSTPIAVDGLWYVQSLKTALPDSSTGMLWQQFLRSGSSSVLGIKGDYSSLSRNSFAALYNLYAGKSYLVIDADLFDAVTLKTLFCRTPEFLKPAYRSVHFSQEHFAQGTLNMAISKSTNAGVRQILEYSYRTIFEFDLMTPLTKSLVYFHFPESFGIPSPLAGMRCAGEPKKFDDPEEIFLSLHSLRSIFMYFGWSVAISIVLLILEIVSKVISVQLERKKIRRNVERRRRRNRIRIHQKIG